ncbi:putative pentatricopeptide repeat-containing protein At5g37570 [Olea europaea var. sylvestris]|uniref:Pentatricopeptide repeat-containing At5g37570 isoform X1 n=1 Tax=Olea europaea subsp. europaea TaxID=158383 RepID=A0A8S0SSD0_OLEEU|nr:putative pentatricopeptide repeat-containing protein At5g37570 [Olea europaea var. sylvestris]CAA2995270.1 pentatricopeptide repeat-containing At5g37570 isoform X1 [Olea europaea subsp. europaea]
MSFPSALGRSSPFQLPIPSLLRACKTIKELNIVHARVIYTGLEQDNFLITQFISLCSQFPPTNLKYITSIFNRVISPNIYLWNNLIKAHCEDSDISECFLVFKRMKRESTVGPDKYTFPSLIKACSNANALREGRVIHGLSVRYGTDGDVFVGSSLIDLYGKCEEINSARKVFDGMNVTNEVSWTAMMVGYLNSGDLFKAKYLFDEMPVKSLATWNAMIKGLVRLGELKGARILFDKMPERNKVSFTTMIDGYAKAGDMATARLLFDELSEKDLFSWSALISGYVQNGKSNEAMKVFGEMWAMNVRPDEFIMVSLMSACSQLGCLKLAKWVDFYICNNSFDLGRAHVAAALVDMNAKCGNMERASFLFEKMPKRDLISFCSMIQGFSMHGNGVQAVALFDRMIDEGLRPDDVAFTVILAACTRAGLVDDGSRYFDIMINEYSLSPSPDHYACMVDLLGKSGKLNAAYELIKSMPVEPHAGAWGALLGACQLQCDTDLAEKVAHRLFELEPHSASSYVLLSNIYAEANRWLEVSHLRGKMSERGLRKIPGCSYVEL